MAISPESKGAAAPQRRPAASSTKVAGNAAADDVDTAVDADAGGEGASSAQTFVTPTRPVVPKLTREGYYMVR